MLSFLDACAVRRADCAACSIWPSARTAREPRSGLEQICSILDLLVALVDHVDTRWHCPPLQASNECEVRFALRPLSVCALACVSRAILEALSMARPAIRTGSFGQARSGALHRRTDPGPIQSVQDALAFERRGVWRIGQLSSLSYSAIHDVTGLSQCRMLHTLQLTQCKHLEKLDGLGRCLQLQRLFVVNSAALQDITGLAGSPSLRILELSGCPRLTDVGALATCVALEHLSLPGCTKIADVACLGYCSALRTLELIGCRGVADIGGLKRCPLLWKLDIRGTGYTPGVTAWAPDEVPILPSVTELRGPGWQDLGVRGIRGKVVQ